MASESPSPLPSPTDEVAPSRDPEDDAVATPLACPLPVVGVVASPGDHSVAASWQVSDDGAEPTEFWVQAGSQVVRTEDTATTISGLRNGVEVEVVVYAATDAGRSAGSEPITVTPLNGNEGDVAGLIVRFASGVDDAVGTQDVAGESASPVDLSITGEVADGAVLVALDEPVSVGEAETIANQLERDPSVEWAEPDQFLFTSSTSTAARSGAVDHSAWNLSGAYGVSAPTDVVAGQGVTVAVIDTGVTDHPALAGRLVDGYDFVTNPDALAAAREPGAPAVAFDGDAADESAYGTLGRDANPADPGDWRGIAPVRDSSWHGTQMAGVIASVVPGAKIEPIRALSWRGGLLSDIAASIAWASGGTVDGVPANANPAKVINMSFSTEAACPVALQSAIDDARLRGAILVAAAGNANDDASKYAPGNCNGVITVGGSTLAGARAAYSNYGEVVDLAAPGGDSTDAVPTITNTGTTTPSQPGSGSSFGTSVAAAHVSAGAALLAARNAALTPDDAYHALTGREYVKAFAGATCDANPDYSCGAGILSLAQIAAVTTADTDFAMRFNGVNQRAKAAAGFYPVDAGVSGTFTVSAWAYDNDVNGGWNYVASQGSGAGDFFLGTIAGSQQIRVSNWDTGYFLPAGEWVHLTVTRSGSSASLYVNSQLVASTTAYPSPNYFTAQPFRIGSYIDDRSENWNGQLDQVKVYNVALSAAQVATDMQTYGMNSSVSSSNYKAFYDFNEGWGSTVVNRVSPGTGDLTAENSPLWQDVKSTSGTSTVTVTFPRTYLTSAGGWRVPAGSSAATALVVGAGGGGGFDGGGAGGGGAVSAGSVSLTAGNVVPVVVGQGGRGGLIWTTTTPNAVGESGSNGGATTLGSVVVAGGGGGGGNRVAGSASSGSVLGGGGGTGANITSAGGSGVYGGGSGAGWNQGGGGGGAGGAGSTASASTGTPGGAAGTGTSSSISGSAVVYGTGGTGGAYDCNFCIVANSNGGGTGGWKDVAATNGTANRGGGGGGGGGYSQRQGGVGGSGIVIVQFTAACAPTSTTNGNYTVVTYSNPGACTWTVPSQVRSVDVLAVGGGGGGGAWVGGGGGGGGVTASNALTVTPGGSIAITVGAGGAGARVGPGGATAAAVFTAGSSGGSSTFGGSVVTALGGGVGASINLQTAGTGSLVATGGGGGFVAPSAYVAGAGATGLTGGAAYQDAQPHPTGGGAGAGYNGTAGTSTASGAGGAGLNSTITGSAVMYGGGGGGSAHGTWPTVTTISSTIPAGAGGGGGGGAGGQVTTSALNTIVLGEQGTDGLGGGGGGAANMWAVNTTYGSIGGDGGDGAVIVRYLTNSLSLNVGGGVQPGNWSLGSGWVSAPKVQLTTASGTALTTSGITVTATFTATSGSATLANATATTNASGVADFSSMTVTGAAGAAGTLTFAVTGFYNAVTSSSFSIVKTAQAALTLTSTSGTYGSSLMLATSGGSGTGVVSYVATVGTALGCTVSAGVLSVTQAGTCLVTATKAADATYNAVSSVQTTVTFAKAQQAALSITSAATVVYGDTITLSTSGGTGTGALNFSITGTTGGAGCSVVSGWPGASTLTGTHIGSSCELEADKDADNNYDITIAPFQYVSVTTRPVTLTASSPSIAYGGSFTPTVTATTGTIASGDVLSGVTYTYAGTGSTTYGPSMTKPTAVGTYSVTPSAATLSSGLIVNYDFTYAAGTVTIAQAGQTITFGALSAVTYGDPAFGLMATATSGLAVSYTSSNTAVCVVTGAVVSITGAGTCTITAAQPGNANIAAAMSVPQTLTVNQASQATLSMTSPSAAVYGQTLTLAASGGSGTGTVTFAATSTQGAGLCGVTGSMLTLGDAGSVCMVRATKAADANYVSAQSAVQTITISRAGNVLAFTSAVPSSPLPNGTYTPTVSSTNATTGTATGVTPTLSVASGSSAVCAMSGGVVTFLTTGSCVLQAAAVQTTNFNAATTATQTITVGALNQTITFARPTDVPYGSSSVSMTASASSTLAVTFARGAGTTNAACTVSPLGVVTVVAVGTCEVVASQAGDSQYAVAPDVSRIFQVNPALPTAPALTSASASDQAITITFVAPGFTGGVPITAYQLVATPTTSGPVVTSSACTTSPCTISGLTNGVTYSVTVAAINAAGTGPVSNASTPLTSATAAYAVGTLGASPGNGTIDLTWAALTNAQLGGGTFIEYRISWRPVGGSWTTPVTLTAQATSTYQITGLTNGTSYEVQLVAVTSANNQIIPGNTATVMEYASTVPSAPRNVTVLAATATDVQVSWQAPLSDGGAALTTPYYAVTLTSSSPGATSPITCAFVTAGDRFCTATGLTNGAVYTASVTASNRIGSSAVGSTTYAVPSSDATLSALVITGTDGVVSLSSGFAAGTTSYSATVAFAVSAVTATPTTTAQGATVAVDGVASASGVASAALPLAVGTTTITVIVTASDPRFTQTYTVQITRLPAPVVPGDPSWHPAPGAVVTPPASVMNGQVPVAVLNGGSLDPDVTTAPTVAGNGWQVTGSGFSLTLSVTSADGSPSPVGPAGQLRATPGSRIVLAGQGYAAMSEIAVFAIPRPSTVGVASRALDETTYLASVTTTASGTINGSINIPGTLPVGEYVLQVNGLSTTNVIRSVNVLLDVVAAAPSPRSVTIRKAAFFGARSATLTSRGRAKLQAMVASVPAGAHDVKVVVVGVSLSAASAADNLDLARDRAKRISGYLERHGVEGEYTVSVSTTFTVGNQARTFIVNESGAITAAATPSALDQPVVSTTGRPLTTASVTFTTPTTT